MAYIGVSPSNGVRRVHTYTASAGQDTFQNESNEGVTLAYRDGTFTDVYQNGVLLGTADYTATSGTSIVLTTAASLNDIIVVIVYDVFGVADTVSKADGGTFDGAVTVSGNFTSSGTITGNAFSGDGSGLSGVGITGWSNNGTNNDLLPASASAGIYLGVNSATASNLLDDYEEGSWTPSLSGVSSHSVAVGQYVRIGNTVTAHANVNGVVSGSGSMTLSGLPFTVNGTYHDSNIGSVWGNRLGSANSFYIYAGSSSTVAAFYYGASGSSGYSPVRYNSLYSDTNMIMRFHYMST